MTWEHAGTSSLVAEYRFTLLFDYGTVINCKKVMARGRTRIVAGFGVRVL